MNKRIKIIAKKFSLSYFAAVECYRLFLQSFKQKSERKKVHI